MKSNEFMNEGIWDAAARYGFFGQAAADKAVTQDLIRRKSMIGAAAQQAVLDQRTKDFFENLKKTIQNKATLGATDVKTAASQAMKQILNKYNLSPADIGNINRFAGELKASGYQIGQELDKSANSAASKMFSIAQDVSQREAVRSQNVPTQTSYPFPKNNTAPFKPLVNSNDPTSQRSTYNYRYVKNANKWEKEESSGTWTPVTDAANITDLNKQWAAGMGSSL